MTGLLLHLLLAASPAPARETVTFRLYKFQQPIGTERSFVVREPGGGTSVRTTFAFSDRSTTVPLASTLALAPDGSARRFAVWGSTSRPSRVDDTVELDGKTLRIDRSGTVRSERAPAVYFVGSGYAPVIVTELLWRYWSAHGKPRSLRLFPEGEALLEPRGSDEVKDDEGRPKKLERYALRGRSWGRETFWIDADGRLIAFKGVDAEFDHFEALRSGYSEALPALVASAAADGMAALRETAASAPPAAGAVAYLGATLVDGTGAPPVRDAVVVVEGDRIAAAGPRSSTAVPAGARRVEVAGKTIVPGLWDMHAHFEQVEWGPVYLAAGVTTVRDCGNELDFIRSVRDTIDAGKGLGPRLLLACFVDGEGPASIGTERLRDESGIPKLIERYQKAQCSQVKIYQSLDPRLIAPLARAAHQAGMSVTGHIPYGIGAVHAVEAGMDQINHVGFVVRALLPGDPDARMPSAEYGRALEQLDTKSEASRATLALLARRGVVVDPTIALDELLDTPHDEMVRREPGLAKVAPELKATLNSFSPATVSPERARFWQTSLETVRALHEAGVTIVAGTDQSVPGHSLHREMELYVEAGFTPMEALQSATLVPARAMRRDKDLGSVEAGKLADLLVVDGDPLADIRNLRKVAIVVQGGRVYDPAKLWRLVGFTP